MRLFASAMAVFATLTWSDLGKLPMPEPAARITYGVAPQQFGELRLPKGDGPFPVFVLIHGGCWLADYDLTYMTRVAAWLTDCGSATWTIEYRRLGDAGGGWPGTFLDVGAAADKLRDIAQGKPLDLKRVYAAGHSAGGQLALWLASRSQLDRKSELHVAQPLAIQGVLGLAAITDLYEYRKGPPGSCNASVEPLLAGTPETVPVHYAETSPLRRLPLRVPQVFVQGERDQIVPPASVRAYVDAAKRAGDTAFFLPIHTAGHFETAVPTGEIENALREALRLLGASKD